MSNANNGLMTKIWGPPGWKFLHSVTFGYPIEPTTEHKKSYKQFFKLAGEVFPCGACRDSYKRFIGPGSDTELTNKIMKNRKNLTKWLFNIHNKVNDKLDKKYGITYNNIKDIYESYRAGNIDGTQCGGSNKLKKKRYRLVK